MLVTLCYLYLWARWGRRPAALVCATVQRLRASRCSFTFCGAAAQPRGARVCLSRGGRVFCVGESQVGGRGRPGVGGAGGARGGGAGRGRREARPRGADCWKRRAAPRCSWIVRAGRCRVWGPWWGARAPRRLCVRCPREPGRGDRRSGTATCRACPPRAGSSVRGGMNAAVPNLAISTAHLEWLLTSSPPLRAVFGLDLNSQKDRRSSTSVRYL